MVVEELDQPLSGFLMICMAAAESTILFERKPVRRIPLVPGSCIVTTVTLITGQYNNISHGYNTLFMTASYSMISEIVPAPTVTLPSLIAKRNCVSIAIGLPNSISRFTLSPGITIDIPSGNCAVPVTSVVRK